MSRTKYSLLCSCVILGVFSCPVPSFSKEKKDEEATKSDAVVISVDVTERGRWRPQKKTILTERVTAKTIEEKQVDSIADIGRLDPSIGYNSRTNSISIRGLDDNRVLTTIDGIRMPWLSDSTRGVVGGVSNFDFASLSTLDIIKGSDSSLFGTGALGGVVALRTIDPEDLIRGGKNWGGLTKMSYDSVDKSWHVDQALAFKYDQTYFLLQGGYAKGKKRSNMGDIGGYGAARTIANPEDFDQENLLFKVHHYVDNVHRFGFTAERNKRKVDGDSWTSSTKTYAPGGVDTTTERKRERLSLSYDYDGGGWLDVAHVVAYWQRQTLGDETSAERLSVPKGSYWRNNRMHETDIGLMGNAAKSFELQNVRHTVRFGGEVYSSKFDQYSAGRDNCPSAPYPPFHACGFLHSNQSDAPKTESLTFGFFVEDEIGFFDNRLRITPGLRYDWFERKPQQTSSYEAGTAFNGYPDDVSDSKFSPKVRIEWDATNRLTLYAQWAQAFRAPTATELYLNYMSPGNYNVHGNPDLEAETSNGFDIGARFGDEYLGGSVSVYSNYYKNFIDRVDLPTSALYPMFVQGYVNRDRVRITGVDMRGHWNLSNGWRFNAGLSYAEGRDRETNEPLNSIPALKAIFGVGYATEIWGADVITTAVANRNKVDESVNNADFAKTPGYALVDLTGWWKPFGESGPRFQAGVYNLFDKKYWEAINLKTSSSTPKDYFTEPGRSFKISMTQQF